MSLPPILTTTEEVEKLAQQLAACSVIAVDLEADSMHNYQEKVCLLQFSTPDTTLLLDPLAGADLSALKPLLADPAIRKIFHAADYDIRCLARDFDLQIDGLFDTMISSQFLGEERFGLADILNKYFNIELDKQYQRADWSKRPLTEGMIRYAAGDTCYLHQLVEILEQKLQEKGRLSWVKEEFALLEKVRFANHQGPEYLRFKGAGRLNGRQLAVLENLLQWRDAEAQRRDCPLYKVLGNKQILALAQTMPTSAAKLGKIDDFPPRLAQRYGSKLLAEIDQGLALAEDQLPVYPQAERRVKDPAADKRFDQLRNWRKKAAAQLELDPGVLINNATLEGIAKRWPRNWTDLKEAQLLKNWQLEELGSDILELLN